MSDESSERMRILQMIESGRISTEQGILLLQSLAESEAAEAEESAAGEAAAAESAASLAQPPAAEPAPIKIATLPEAAPPADEAPVSAAAGPAFEAEPPLEGEVIDVSRPAGLPAGAEKWKRFWVLPLGIGVGIAVLGAALMYSAQVSSGLGFWFLCASLPFALGVMLMALAIQSRVAPWLHLRVQQPPGESPQRIALSFPLPIRPLVWFLRTFGHNIPELREHSVDEILLAVGETTSSDNPIYIEANDEDGTHVEIYIG